jgi:SAM-dependent methyltransferase
MRILNEQERLYLEHLRTFDAWNRQAILAVMGTFGIPASYLDVGCGTGAMVGAVKRMGADAQGVDLLVPDDRTPYLFQVDVAQPFDLGRAFDLVTCIEVAEHIPEQATDVFLDNVSRHLGSPGIFVLSAAGPGQGGENHKFLRPGYWWRTELHNRQIAYREDYTMRLRLVWSVIPMPMMWLAANVQVFER